MKQPMTSRRAAILCAATACGSFAVAAGGFYAYFNYRLPDYVKNQALYKKMAEIREYFDHYYVGEYDEQDAIDMAAAGYVVGVGDRWSVYLSKDEYESYLQSFDGKSSGVGLWTSYHSETQELRIIEVYEGSSALDYNLKKGDCILAAEGKTVEEHGYSAVRDAIAGELNTTVDITIRRAQTGETEVVTLTRRETTQTMVTGKMLDDETGYVYIYNFNKGAEEQFDQVLDALLAQGATQLIFDVRNNPGGSVDTVCDMLDRLLPEGDIMTLRTKSGKETVYTSDKNSVDLPMVVLMNEESYSAAEFFAAALREYDMATLVGGQTVGKGYSQRPYQLSDGSAIRMSDQAYYTPQGNSLIGVGLTPDIALDLTEEQIADFYFLQPEEDAQLSAAWDSLQDKG